MLLLKPVVEWRRLLRFRAKMTPFHPRALLCIEKISYSYIFSHFNICLNWLYYLYHVLKRFFFIVMLLCLKQSIVFILSFQLLKLKCMQRLYSSFIIFVFICWRVLRSEPVTTIYKHFTENIIFIFLVTSTECNLSSLNMKGWKVTNIHIYLSPFFVCIHREAFCSHLLKKCLCSYKNSVKPWCYQVSVC